MSRTSELIKFIHQYRYETGAAELDMHEVSRWLELRGMRMPRPKSPRELLAKELSKAAAQEIRHDTNGRPYRANHAVTTTRNGAQLTFWVDIDEAPRRMMHKSLIQRREQMVGDAVQLTFDAEHWNAIHPNEDPIVIPLDFTEDVEWRRNSDDNERQAG